MFRASFRSVGLKRAVRLYSSDAVSNTKPEFVSRHAKPDPKKYLEKFYTKEMLESARIAESLVDPQTYIGLKLGGNAEKSKVAPAKGKLFLETDPKWDEPILYPNQAKGKTPYPPIPREANPDTSDLKARFVSQDVVGPKTFSRESRIERVALLTGFNKKFIQDLHVVNVLIKRVSCQTGKGKIPNFYAMTVVGDRNGMVGMGEGKSRQGVRFAMDKGFLNAVKNLKPIARYEDRTIIGEIDYKYHAVKLSLKSAPAGFGLRINPVLFEVCEAAGIKDLRGKITRSRNRMNTVKGFLEALSKERPIEELAAGRGKKIVDLRKVYYSA